MTLIKFGRYELIERVGASEAAEVFKARSLGAAGFEKIVAIKRLRPELIHDEAAIRLFTEGARISASLTHANIVQVFEFGRIDDTPYWAMEYLNGAALRVLLHDPTRIGKPLPLPLALHIVHAVAGALGYAHARQDSAGQPHQLLHLAVNPQNILISFEGAVKLTGFGIGLGRSQSSSDTLRESDQLAYCSPEQIERHTLDVRSDVFSLGCVLYECVLGRPAFGDESAAHTVERIRRGQMRRPRELQSTLPEEVEAIVTTSLAHNPERRFASMDELEQSIESFAREARLTFNAKQVARWMQANLRDEVKNRTDELESLPTPADGGPSLDEVHGEAIAGEEAELDDYEQETSEELEDTGRGVPVSLAHTEREDPAALQQEQGSDPLLRAKPAAADSLLLSESEAMHWDDGPTILDPREDQPAGLGAKELGEVLIPEFIVSDEALDAPTRVEPPSLLVERLPRSKPSAAQTTQSVDASVDAEASVNANVTTLRLSRSPTTAPLHTAPLHTAPLHTGTASGADPSSPSPSRVSEIPTAIPRSAQPAAAPPPEREGLGYLIPTLAILSFLLFIAGAVLAYMLIAQRERAVHPRVEVLPSTEEGDAGRPIREKEKLVPEKPRGETPRHRVTPTTSQPSEEPRVNRPRRVGSQNQRSERSNHAAPAD